MTDKTEAMDNLIAQDADLIEICPDDLVQRLRDLAEEWFEMCDDIHEPLYEAADRIEAQAAEIERLNKSAECLAESRRLAVKDLAVLEGHMRLEIGQWKVDYDCAIMDVEHLRERIEALTTENERLRKALRFYADAKNWAYVKSAGCNCVDADSGDTARAALEQIK
jgi:uncharacterized small protein (DUF1192 family)